MGVPVMDEDGKVKLFGKLDLAGKPVFLRFLIRVEIVIVQPDLPHRFHLVMRPSKRTNGCERLLRRILCHLRMDADCCIKRRVALCESHRFFTGHKVFGRDDHVVQRLAYVMDDLFPVTVKGFVVQVRMGIEEPHHFTRLPAGMSTKGTLRLPSFDAARIIPCDSIPMSFAGFRFDTKMTCLPMSSSG